MSSRKTETSNGVRDDAARLSAAAFQSGGSLGECQQDLPYAPIRPVIDPNGDLLWCCNHPKMHCGKAAATVIAQNDDKWIISVSRFRDILQPAWLPLRVLLVMCLGILLFRFSIPGDAKVGLILVVVGVASFSDRIGRGLLHWKPALGLLLMELWILAPIAAAVLAVSLSVFAAAKFALLITGATEPLATELRTWSGAIGTFLSSSFVTWLGDKNDSRLARRIAGAFQAVYRRTDASRETDPGSPLERLVHANEVMGITGWSFQARWARADEIARLGPSAR